MCKLGRLVLLTLKVSVIGIIIVIIVIIVKILIIGQYTNKHLFIK